MKTPLQLLYHTSIEADIKRSTGLPPRFYHELSFCKAAWVQLPNGIVTIQERTGNDYVIWQWNIHLSQQLDCFVKADEGCIFLLQPVEVTDVLLLVEGQPVHIWPKMMLMGYLPAGVHPLRIHPPSAFLIFMLPPLSFLEGLRTELPGIAALQQAYLNQQPRLQLLPAMPMLTDGWMRLKRLDVPTLKQGIPDLHLRRYIIDVLHDYGKMAKEAPRSELLFVSNKQKAILLQQYLLEQMMDPSQPTLEELAKKFYAEPRSLSKAFQQLTGKTILQFSMTRRLEHALELTQNTRIHVKEIGFRCGFNDISHFIRSFKKRYGSTPGQMRRQSLH